MRVTAAEEGDKFDGVRRSPLHGGRVATTWKLILQLTIIAMGGDESKASSCSISLRRR